MDDQAKMEVQNGGDTIFLDKEACGALLDYARSSLEDSIRNAHFVWVSSQAYNPKIEGWRNYMQDEDMKILVLLNKLGIVPRVHIPDSKAPKPMKGNVLLPDNCSR